MPKYRFRNFLLDSVLAILTCGFWLIWIFCREMRGNPKNNSHKNKK